MGAETRWERLWSAHHERYSRTRRGIRTLATRCPADIHPSPRLRSSRTLVGMTQESDAGRPPPGRAARVVPLGGQARARAPGHRGDRGPLPGAGLVACGGHLRGPWRKRPPGPPSGSLVPLACFTSRVPLREPFAALAAALCRAHRPAPPPYDGIAFLPRSLPGSITIM